MSDIQNIVLFQSYACFRSSTKYRNGFSHTWASEPGAYSDIEEKGLEFYESLKQVVDLLEEENFFA